MAPKNKTHAEAAEDLLLEKGLPSDPATEKLCLGAVLVNPEKWDILANLLSPEDFSLNSNKILFARMNSIADRGETIDRITLVNELVREGQLESAGGISAVSSLDEGLPDIVNLEGYCRIVKDKAQLRRIIFNAQRQLIRALEAHDSPQEIATEAVESLEAVQSGQKKEVAERTIIEVIEQYPGGVSTFLDPNLRPKGLPSGLSRLDEMTNGFHAGELIIIAARPGMGKTALALNIAQHLSMHPSQRRFGCFFSLEMTADQLITRMLCAAARVDQHKFRAGYLGQDDRRKLHVALNDLTECRLKINDTFGITVREVCRHIKRMKKDEGLQFAVLDYIQLAGTQAKGENRNLEVAAMSRELKMLAGECEIPMIVLSQLSRSNEKRTGSKVPILSDLRDSGAIEQDADLVLFIHREELYKRDDESVRGLADIIIGKQRHGPSGTVGVRFCGAFTRFENRFEDGPSEDGN
jgi:replicative DNA helicase